MFCLRPAALQNKQTNKQKQTHTCNEHACVAPSGLGFSLTQGGGVRWQFSVVQPVTSQHPVNAAVIGMLKDTHTRVHIHTKIHCYPVSLQSKSNESSALLVLISSA